MTTQPWIDPEAEPIASVQLPVRTVPNLLPQRFGRRELLFGTAAALPVLAGGGMIERLASSSNQASTPQAGITNSATPVAGATPVTGETIGRLRVIRDQRPEYDTSPEPSGHLQLMLTAGDNLNFNPAAFAQDFQIPISYLDPLVWIDEVTLEPEPWLAKSWKLDQSNRIITFALRADPKWHDGSGFTANDVVFSFYVYRDDVASNVRNFFAAMDRAEAVDKHTVQVVLTEPDSNWLLNAASQLIFQRKQYEKHWNARPEGERTLSGFDWTKRTPIGTGPWKIADAGNTSISFIANNRSWGEKPYFDDLTLRWDVDPLKRFDAWKGGQIDALWPVRPADIASASDSTGFLYVADAPSVMFAAFNFDNQGREQHDLLADLNLRKALSLAINRDRYAKKAFQGFIHQERAGTVAQPWAYDASVTNPARDVTKARELLRTSGWVDRDGNGIAKKNGTKLELTLIVENDARPELLSVLGSIVEDLKDAGAALEIQKLSPDQFQDRWTARHDFDLIAFAYNLYPGFTDFDLYGSAWDIRVNSQGFNPGGYHNKDVDSAIKDYFAAENLDGQRKAMANLQQAANEDLFGLWFGFPQNLILVRPDVLGYQPNMQWETWDTRKLWRIANPVQTDQPQAPDSTG
ncbi:MAG: ABC transporter substrate-binding protein [Thermomicrobiales bacterium]